MSPLNRFGSTGQRLSLCSAQPNLDSPVFLATLLRIVGSDWQVLSESIHHRRFYASHLQLIGDRSGAVLGKRNILFCSASAVGETEQQKTPFVESLDLQKAFQAVPNPRGIFIELTGPSQKVEVEA